MRAYINISKCITFNIEAHKHSRLAIDVARTILVAVTPGRVDKVYGVFCGVCLYVYMLCECVCECVLMLCYARA